MGYRAVVDGFGCLRARMWFVALMGWALVACAGAGVAPEPAPLKAASQTPVMPPVELHALVTSDPVAERLLSVAIRGFVGRHPDAEIKVDTVEGDPVPRLKALAAQGALPDVIWATDAELEALVGAGLLMDVQDLARLDRNVDPNAFDPGCDCQRPPAPFRLENITSQALAASRVSGRPGLYMIPALQIDRPAPEKPSFGGFAIAASTSRLEMAWAFVRYLATEDAQRAVLKTYPEATVLRSLSANK